MVLDPWFPFPFDVWFPDVLVGVRPLLESLGLFEGGLPVVPVPKGFPDELTTGQ